MPWGLLEGLIAQDRGYTSSQTASCRCSNLCNEPLQHGIRACKLNSRSVPPLLSPASRTLLILNISLFLASLISYVALVLVSLSLFASNFYLLLWIFLIDTTSALITELGLVCFKCGGVGRRLLVIWKIHSPKLCRVPISCVSLKLHGGLASGLIACQTSQQIKSISHRHPQLSRHLVFLPAGIFRECLQLIHCL